MKDISSNGILSAYDLLDGEFDTGFRIVRMHLGNGNYICIAANLSEEEFSLKEIKNFTKCAGTGKQVSGSLNTQ